jgi:superfamily II DNA or RNA helicase
MAQLGDRFGLVIVDEVHHFGAGLRDRESGLSHQP